MPQSQYRARQVGAKTNEVVGYHNDESLPGKPLHILIPGGLVALGALAVIILVIYETWFQSQLDQSTGIVLLALLAPFYIGGVFLFSYGYELYNIPRAIRLTAIIVFLTLAAVVIVAVLFVVLAGGGKIPEGSSGKKSSGGGSKGQTRNVSSPSSSGGPNIGPVVFLPGMGGGMHTNTVTREVVKEVEVPVAPKSINCPSCNRGYVPSEEKYICPSCGMPTPRELIDDSEMPRDSSEN